MPTNDDNNKPPKVSLGPEVQDEPTLNLALDELLSNNNQTDEQENKTEDESISTDATLVLSQDILESLEMNEMLEAPPAPSESVTPPDWVPDQSLKITIIDPSENKLIAEKFIGKGRSIIIGRSSGDLLINHRSVSSEHCTISFDNNLLSIIDHNTTNGTLVNGVRIRPRRMVLLEEGDSVFLGQIKLNFSLPTKKVSSASSKREVQNIDHLFESEDPQPEEKKKKKKTKKFKKDHKKTQSRSIKKASNSKIDIEDPRIVGPFPRVMSMLGDLALSIILIGILKINSNAYWVLADLGKLNNKIFTFLPDALLEYSLYFLVYLFIRLFFALVLGVSPLQFLMGIRSKGQKAQTRIGSFIRELIGPLLLPFFIFDAPLLSLRPSFKERFSGTVLINIFPVNKIIVIVFVVPILLISPLYLQFLSNWEFKSGMVIANDTLSGNRFLESKTKGETLFNSKFFQMEGRFQKNSRYEIFIGYDILSENKKKKLSPYLAILDKENENNISIRVRSKNILYAFLKTAKEQDPEFSKKYPTLEFLINKGRTYFGPIRGLEPPAKILGNDIVIAIKDFMKKSFGLNLEKLQHRIMDLSFFIQSELSFRDQFIANFGLNPKSSLSFIKLNNTEFLRVRPKVRGDFIDLRGKEYLVPIDTINGLVYEITYDQKPGDNKTLKDLYRYILSFNYFTFDLDLPGYNLAPEGPVIGDFQLGHIPDEFHRFDISVKNMDRLFLWISHQMYLRGNKYFTDEKYSKHAKAVKDFYVDVWRSISEVAKVLEKVHKGRGGDIFAKHGGYFYFRDLEKDNSRSFGVEDK